LIRRKEVGRGLRQTEGAYVGEITSPMECKKVKKIPDVNC